MPKTQEILLGLNTIVNNYSWFAILWHAIFYILLTALLLKWIPSNRLLGTLLCIPLISVAVFAWITGNPFKDFGPFFPVLDYKFHSAAGLLYFIIDNRRSDNSKARFTIVPG